eukprot:m51a1_g1397 hypothetical protein (282) ;mRNA; f:486146-487239
MDTRHSRIVPDVVHTLDDLVFAAFQGPVLGLSSRVLYQFRTFTALLLLRTRWRTDRRLSQADVTDALLRARCCVPGTLVAAQCHTCGRVLDVSENAGEQDMLRRELPAGVELYAVSLRTVCTSSRQHVGSAMLVLAAELEPGAVVVSDRFAVYARHAARHVARQQRDASLVSPLPGPPLAGMAVAVRINAVRFTPEEGQQFAAGIVPVLRDNVPGYLVHKSSLVGGSPVVVVVVGATSLGSLVLANGLWVRFVQNQIRNPLDRDLIADGLLQPLLAVTNMD